jgi:predicted CoA-binding protein
MKDLKDKRTMVLIASPKPDRYSFMAVKLLVEHEVPVVAIARRHGYIDDTELLVGRPHINDLHTLSLYLNPTNQRDFYDYILALAPKRVIFNPGTENEELQDMLSQNKIHWEEACTLVLLRTHQY